MKLQKYINTIGLTAVLCVAAQLTVWSALPPVDSITAQVTQGQWQPDLGAAITYSETNDVPLLYVWGVQGCANSDKLAAYTNTAAFTQWAAARKLVMVYIKASDTITTDQKDFAKIGVNGSLTEYPFVAVYWASKDSRTFNFSGRYSSSSNTDGAEQLIAEVEFYIDGYVTPVPYDEWTVAENIPVNLRGYDDDPANDDIPNLIKYASGLPAMTLADTSDLMNIVENPGLNTFEIEYYVSKSAMNVTLEPVWASTLDGPWQTPAQSPTWFTKEWLADEGDRELWKAILIKDDQGFIKLRATAD